jgi:hypothetical protein
VKQHGSVATAGQTQGDSGLRLVWLIEGGAGIDDIYWRAGFN